MCIAIDWKFSMGFLGLCSLALLGCSGVEIQGNGPPASEQQVMRMLSGNSFDARGNGQVFQSADGSIKSFGYHSDGPRVCEGVWFVEESEETNILNCRWVQGGKIFVRNEIEEKFYYRLSSAYGLDLIGEDGLFIAFLPFKYGKTYGSFKHRGFPRWDEFYALSKKLGL